MAKLLIFDRIIQVNDSLKTLLKKIYHPLIYCLVAPKIGKIKYIIYCGWSIKAEYFGPLCPKSVEQACFQI